MKTWVAAGVVLLAAGRAYAQQQEDPVERQVQRYKDQFIKVTGKGEPVQLRGAQITADAVAALKVRPVIGRLFKGDEDKPGATPAISNEPSGPAVPGAMIANGVCTRGTTSSCGPNRGRVASSVRTYTPIRS